MMSNCPSIFRSTTAKKQTTNNMRNSRKQRNNKYRDSPKTDQNPTTSQANTNDIIGCGDFSKLKNRREIMATNAIASCPTDAPPPTLPPLLPKMCEKKIENQQKSFHKKGKHEKTHLMSRVSTSQGLFTQEGLPEVSC